MPQWIVWLGMATGCIWLPDGQKTVRAEGSAPGECSDTEDNDEDGAVDCDDSDCAQKLDCADPALGDGGDGDTGGDGPPEDDDTDSNVEDSEGDSGAVDTEDDSEEVPDSEEESEVDSEESEVDSEESDVPQETDSDWPFDSEESDSFDSDVADSETDLQDTDSWDSVDSETDSMWWHSDDADSEDTDSFDTDTFDSDSASSACDPTTEVAWNGRCYYLDGSGGSCEAGYELAPQSALNTIASDFVGKTYKNDISDNCCIWHRDQATELQDWGMTTNCNAAGPFEVDNPSLGGTSCINVLVTEPLQLTFCMTGTTP